MISFDILKVFIIYIDLIEMAAIIRVKRRNDHEPMEALIVACKKRKTEPENAEAQTTTAPFTAVIKFAGTVKDRVNSSLIICIILLRVRFFPIKTRSHYFILPHLIFYVLGSRCHRAYYE